MNDKPKNQPEEDWAMTTPNLQVPDELKPGNFPESSAPQKQSSDDWAMTEPNVNIPPAVVPSTDSEKTAPNLNISQFEPPSASSPAQSSDDWMMSNPNVKLPAEQKSDGWEMPKPVFRVSGGTDYVPQTAQNQPNFEKTSPDADFSNESSGGAGTASPYFRREENRQEKSAPTVQAQTSAPKKGSKIPLIFGGIFLMFFIGCAFLVGIYLLFLRNTEPLQVLNTPPKTNTAQNTDSSPVSSSSTTSGLPASINYKGEMVLIPAGEFTMGTDAGEDISQPAHSVVLPAFYIDKYEVTNAQYKEFCDATGKTPPVDPDFDKGYFLNRPNAPVMGVSYDDAKAYAEWAGKRLPTEAEWEKAASWDEAGKTKREFPWGSDFSEDQAAFKLPAPSDVGKYAADTSPFGAMDMAGNAFEWVDGFFKAYPGSRAANGQFGEKNRVVRGGSFDLTDPDFLKTTKRIYAPPKTVTDANRQSYIGFRCAIAADDARLKDSLAAGSK